MPKLKDVIEDLIASFGIRESISNEEYLAMQAAYTRGEYVRCIAQVRKFLKLSMLRIRIAYLDNQALLANSPNRREGSARSGADQGEIRVAMQIARSENMPLFGTAAFARSELRLNINTDLLCGSCDEFIFSAAHELSHIILYSTYHPWRHSEKATDILAMLQGFLEVGERVYSEDASYLSQAEVAGICNYIRKKKVEK